MRGVFYLAFTAFRACPAVSSSGDAYLYNKFLHKNHKRALARRHTRLSLARVFIGVKLRGCYAKLMHNDKLGVRSEELLYYFLMRRMRNEANEANCGIDLTNNEKRITNNDGINLVNSEQLTMK